MSTNVYIDGFNFYYGAVRGTGYKWLNFRTLCEALLPGHRINRIRYFTARPRGLPNDPDVSKRHAIYIRALRTIPSFEIHFGKFVDRVTVLPQFPLVYPNNADPSKHPPLMVQVKKSEEKGSDVNLASHLLLDCFKNDFDEAVVISNDADLVEPIKIVTQEFIKNVTVINPQRRSKIQYELRQAATSYMREINTRHLANSQFPSTISDVKGTFTKPAVW